MKVGEDVTETLELVPRRWKPIQRVREKLVCRAHGAITQPLAPSHARARERAWPKLLVHVLFAKYGLHLPLNRQSNGGRPVTWLEFGYGRVVKPFRTTDTQNQ